MMKKSLLALTACAACAASAQSDLASALGKAGSSTDTIKLSADQMVFDNETGAMKATGNVTAEASPYRLLSSGVSRTTGGAHGTYRTFTFGDNTVVTTCTNELGHLHWRATGSLTYRDHTNFDRVAGEPDEIVAEDMTLRLWEIPVAWLPYAWIPRNTDYGWRVMPGYTGRWGAYLLTKYVYTLASSEDGAWRLGGNTRFDLRSKNGVALGQSVNWHLGDFGKGKFKVYYAWDEDADRYDRQWRSDKWNYSNWSSDVPDERYALMLQHNWDPSDRDTVRLRAVYYSDSCFLSDFLREAQMGLSNRYPVANQNELTWEHRGDVYNLGATVSGQLNDFYGGTSRLPEFTLDLMPQPVLDTPMNYESQSRAGWLNRNYGKLGAAGTALPFRYSPGVWADYQAFRGDTYHRLTVPLKFADVLSVVPRFALRGTWWSDVGATDLSGTQRTRSLDEDVSRSIVEGGVTFSARGKGWLSDRWQHLTEPYLDVLVQQAHYSGLERDARPYIFDSADGSCDWLDQFAGRSRNLPYSWSGMTPGWRNAFRKADEKGLLRTVFDLDVYAAIQMNDTSWTAGNRYHRQARDREDPNYERMISPGVRARWFATKDVTLMSRAEWDGENNTVSYADVSFTHTLSKDFKYEVSYSTRDQRWWDYSSSPYDPALLRNEDFNWTKYSFLEVGFEHDICDAVAWGPFARWDCRENELDEIGGWVDYRTDCLGFRLSLSYEKSYRRIDYSERDDNWRCSFGIYLRALGPGTGMTF